MLIYYKRLNFLWTNYKLFIWQPLYLNIFVIQIWYGIIKDLGVNHNISMMNYQVKLKKKKECLWCTQCIVIIVIDVVTKLMRNDSFYYVILHLFNDMLNTFLLMAVLESDMANKVMRNYVFYHKPQNSHSVNHLYKPNNTKNNIFI